MRQNNRLQQRSFERVVALEPSHSSANLQLARMALDSGNLDRAWHYFRHLKPEDAQSPEVVLLRAQALLAQGRRSTARELLRRLRQTAPNDAAIAFSAASVLFQYRLYPDAAQAFADAARLAPNDFEPVYNLGLALRRLGRRPEGAQALERAVELQPTSADAYHELALAYSEQGEDLLAIRTLLRARPICPNDARLLLLLGRECLQAQFYQEASDALERYAELRPDDVEIRRALALAYEEAGELEKAADQLSRYLERYPDNAAAYIQRAGIWKRAGQRSRQEQDLQRALRVRPNAVAAVVELGVLKLEQGQLTEAEPLFRRVLAADPQSAPATFGLGRTRLEAGQPRSALPLLEKAATPSAPPEVHFTLFRAYSDLHQTEKAVQQLQVWRRSLRRVAQTARDRAARYANLLREELKFQPGNFVLNRRLAEALLDADNTAAALDWLATAALASSPAQSHLEAARILLQHDLSRAAVSHLDSAAAAPLDDVWRGSLAAAYMQAGELHTVRHLIASAATTTAPLVTIRARLEEASGEYENALADYQRAIQIAPAQESNYADLITFLINNQAYDAAALAISAAKPLFPQSRRLPLLEAIRSGLNGDPRHAYEGLLRFREERGLDGLGEAVAGLLASYMNDRRLAKDHMERSVALATNDPLPYYYLALFESQSENANLGLAIEWLNASLERNPNLADALALRGQLLFKSGKPREAQGSLENAIRLKPNAPEPHFLLARVYTSLGRTGDAQREFRENDKLRQQAHASKALAAERQLLVRIQEVY